MTSTALKLDTNLTWPLHKSVLQLHVVEPSVPDVTQFMSATFANGVFNSAAHSWQPYVKTVSAKSQKFQILQLKLPPIFVAPLMQ